MKYTMIAAAMSLATLLAVAAPSNAGNLDHLLCYRMKDPLQIKTAVDMIAEVQPEFTQKGCTLMKAFEFCVPATKTNVQPPATVPAVMGQPLQDDYICYLAQCPTQVGPPDRQVIDQFGQRVQHKYRPFKVCVPARKAPVGCGPTSTSARAPQCAGACPNAADDCRLDVATKQCTCVPKPCGGVPDNHGMCGGGCPTATDRCLPSITSAGKRVCTCQPPPPPPCGLNTSNGQCGGECPNPTEKCTFDAANHCSCTPVEKPCGIEPGTNSCSGKCPNAGDVCNFSAVAGCQCQPQSCSQNPLNGTCGGPCPNATDKCILDTTNTCKCQPPPCGSDPATGACGGACPVPGACRIDPATNSCRCG